MSRLDSFIRRMSAQRDILNDLEPCLRGIPGPILEFGLGSGRTYDHLREHFPDRRILVFESVPSDSARPEPPAADLIVGDIRETASRLPDGIAALIHADIETGSADEDAELLEWLPDLVARLLASNGYAASGCALPDARLAPCVLPAEIPEGRYHVVRRLERPRTLSGTGRPRSISPEASVPRIFVAS